MSINNALKCYWKHSIRRHFEVNEPIFIFTDGHKTGLGAILCQGKNQESVRPLAVACRATSKAEANYPQLHLAMAVDFALRRLKDYILGAPEQITAITDHKPLCSIFNLKKKRIDP